MDHYVYTSIKHFVPNIFREVDDGRINSYLSSNTDVLLSPKKLPNGCKCKSWMEIMQNLISEPSFFLIKKPFFLGLNAFQLTHLTNMIDALTFHYTKSIIFNP